MQRITRRRRRYALAAFGAALALGLSACQTESAGPEVGADIEDLTNEFGALEEDVNALEERVGALEEEVGVADGAAEDDFFGDPESFIGQQVTVSGEVTEILTQNAFRLSGGVDTGVLVVSAQQMADLSEGALVQVTGTVRQFNIAEFEQDLGIGFDEGVFGEFEGQTAIVADSIDQSVPQEQEDS